MNPANSNAQSASERILESLRTDGPQTALELAARFRITGPAIRAQLRPLVAAGLITREGGTPGPSNTGPSSPARTATPAWTATAARTATLGRPAARYHLAPAADARFPKRYELFARHLLETLVAELGPDALKRVLSKWEEDLHAHLDVQLPKNPTARLQALAEHQTANGFMAEVRQDADGGVALIERNCPIATLAAKHPEICDHEASLFSRTLKWKTSLESCQARGDGVCVFRIGRARPSAGPNQAAAKPAAATAQAPEPDNS